VGAGGREGWGSWKGEGEGGLERGKGRGVTGRVRGK